MRDPTSRPARSEQQEDKRLIVKRRHLQFHATRRTSLSILDDGAMLPTSVPIERGNSERDAAGLLVFPFAHKVCFGVTAREKNENHMYLSTSNTLIRERDRDIVRTLESTEAPRVVLITSVWLRAKCDCMC